jgi:hypothetical protein
MIEVNGLNTLVKAGGDTDDIINALLAVTPKAVDQVCKSNFNIKLTGNAEKDGFTVAKWIKENIKYKQDGYANQNIKLAGRLIKDGFGDCKSFALLFNCIMSKNGYKTGYRFASYRKNKVPTHVYNYVLDSKGKKYIFDACSKTLLESNKHTFTKDMNINYLSGIDTAGIYGKAEREARKAARKQKRADRKKDGGGGRGKKILLAPVRGAFLSLVGLNVRGLATKMGESIAKDKNTVKAFWERLGGKFTAFEKRVDKSKGKKALFGKKRGVNGYEEFIEKDSYLSVAGVDDAAIAAFIAAAAPVLVAASKLFKKLGVKAGDGDVVTGDEAESGEKLPEGFTAGDSENDGGADTGGDTVGFKPSPLLIGGGIAAIAALYFIMKKKK